MEKLLVSSDWHLTDNPNDEYRWGIFDWFKVKSKELKIDAICILGDLLDKKDFHSAVMVNRVVNELYNLALCAPVYLLRGNHDGIRADLPYLKFINSLNKQIRYIIEPTIIDNILFLPHSRNPEEEWTNWTSKFKDVDYIMLHQTFSGAISENGMKLSGLSAEWFDNIKATVISGDVHVPQKIRNITYVGSPYRVHYGDSFTPRIFYVEESHLNNLYYDTIKRHTIEVTSKKEFIKFLESDTAPQKGDQVKLRILVDSKNIVDMDKTKAEIEEICKDKGFEVNSTQFIKQIDDSITQTENKISHLSPEQILEKYCSINNIESNLFKYGEKIIQGLI